MALVHDNLRRQPNPLGVRVFSTPVVEAIIAFWATANGPDLAHEHADAERILALGSGLDELGDEVAWMGGDDGHRWLALLGIVDGADAATLAGLADAVEALDAESLVGVFVEACSEEGCFGDAEPGDVLGDPPTVHRSVVTALRVLDERVGEAIAEFEPVLRHGVELEQFLSRRLGLDQLVESVTNGVVYQPEAGVTEVVLVPSVLLRPWNILLRLGTTSYIVHPIAEESLGAEEDTPPSWLIDLFKALGDPRRLRLLRHLRQQGGVSLGAAAEFLDLAKSTTHHHLRTLRAAGLVRTRIVDGARKDEQIFELRTDLLPDAVAAVEAYLLGDDR